MKTWGGKGLFKSIVSDLWLFFN